MIKKLAIQVAPETKLEAELNQANSQRAGVVAHPHPLYGGSMHNNVVQAACQSLYESGWTSLCFNFRGVGSSTGLHDDGRGEQDDLVAAASILVDGGIQELLVIGYSFGAWVAAMAWTRLAAMGVKPLLLIAPPVAFMSFDKIPSNTRIGLIVSGEHDSFGPPDMVRALGIGLQEPVEPLTVAGTDHFFGGYEQKLRMIITQHLGHAGRRVP